MLGKVADGEDPAGARASARRFSTLREAFHGLHEGEAASFQEDRHHLPPLGRALSRRLAVPPLDSIERREVEERFILLTENHGWALANLTISLLRSIYRRPCVDNAGLRNPVDLWLASGGRFNPVVRRRISSPSEVLPCWRRGIKAAVTDPMIRDIFWIGMYSGMRLGEILTLHWDNVDFIRRVVRVPHTKTGVPLELPITRQLLAILERRRVETDGTGWVFRRRRASRGI